MICIVSTRLEWWKRNTKEGYGSPSCRPSFAPPTVWKKAKETQRAGCGQEDVKRGRQRDKPEREEGEAGRQGERAAGRETRQGEKRRWFGSQLLLSDDLLPCHAVTDTHKQAFTAAGLQAQLQKSLRWPENVSQADIFTLENTHNSLITVEQLSVRLHTASLPACVRSLSVYLSIPLSVAYPFPLHHSLYSLLHACSQGRSQLW